MKRLFPIMFLMCLGTVLSFAQTTASFKGMVVSGHADCIRLCEKVDDNPVKSTPTVGPVSRVAVQNDSLIVALAADNFIYSSTDGLDWHLMDFCATYGDYYGWCSLVMLAASDYDFMVVGADENGEPLAFTSVQGRIWSPRPLEYPVAGGYERLEEMPVDLLYDGEHDRYEMVLGNGDRLLLPACSHCNALVKGQ
ncbi:MAG: hypothetical protein MJZ06_07400 [Bacteroidaceae bacterium]|nr:hypothetical protein [Bacteroidaceae bacterium]